METKPYSLQSPETVAKEYGGNKQKIAEAAQMGIIDPTAAVLAGMFIDRMRAAQMQEQVPQTTVAQQVMGGLPPAPVVPSPPPGGLGSTPQAGPSMAPQMLPQPEMVDVPMPSDEMPEMAAGGLTTLSVPDTMFDEPSNGGFNDGYAGGGIVAFARGGMSNLYDSVEYWESGGKQSAVSPKGARGVMQLMPGTMRDPGFGVPSIGELIQKGMGEEEANREVGRKYLDAMYRKYGDQATALAAYNWGPGNVDKWLKSGADPKKLPAETRSYISKVMQGTEPPIRNRDISTPEGQIASTEDIFGRLQERFGPTAEEKEIDEARMARAKEMASDEYYNKQRKSDMWQTLAEIGFNMASSKSPYLLQAIGEAAAAALPGAKADKKERKALKDRALDVMADMNGLKRRENLQLYGMAVDAAKTNMQQQQFEKKIEIDERQVDLAEKRLNEEIRQAGLVKPEEINDRVTRYLLDYAPGTPQHEAAKRVFEAKRPATTGAVNPTQRLAELAEGRDGSIAEGTTAKDTDGKTIVFSGGQWVYP